MRNRIAVAAAALGLALTLGACGAGAAADSDSSAKQASAPYDHYTVVFDKNTTPDDLTDDESFTYYTSGWGAQQKSSVVEIPYAVDACIPADDVPTPTRKGYYFAGWQTVPVVEQSDIVNGVSTKMVFFGQKVSEFGQAAGAVDDGPQAMYLKDFENLTQDGTVTLYARWVEATPVSSEEDLRAMANDLYGAYVLTCDIELSGDWEPVGAYYENYENWKEAWWTYAFRGTLDGAGHTITGLKVTGAMRELPADETSAGAVWNGDGQNVDGVAALFGAMANATVSDLTIDGAAIDIAGDNAYSGAHCYAGVLAAFDFASTAKNVRVVNSQVNVEFDDAGAGVAKPFVAVGALEAGGWSNTLSDCAVEGCTVTVNGKLVDSHGGEYYVGGLVGECYSTMKNNTVTAAIALDIADECALSQDSPLKVNVGGNGAANTSAAGDVVDATLNVAVSKPVGESCVNVGGFTGSQRYLSADGNTVKAAIETKFSLDSQKGVSNVGAVAGNFDLSYGALILMYADGVTCGSSNNVTDVTLNGQSLDVVIPSSALPQQDGQPVIYIATGDYSAADGTVYKENFKQVVDGVSSYSPAEGEAAKIMYISFS